MEIKNLLLGALVTSMALTACEKSENTDSPNRDEMPKSVTITLPNINQISRATGNAMKAEQVSLKNFKVFFLDAAGEVQTLPEYNGEQKVYFSSDDDADWSAIGDAGRDITYHFVPAATTKVVVLGNLGDVADYKAIIAAEQNVLNDGDADITKDANGHPLYPLYGESNLALKAAGKDDQEHTNVYTANVSLAPRIARFEIYGFGYSKDPAATDFAYTKLELNKIALSNYHTKYTLANGDAAGDVVVCPTETAQVWDYIATTAKEPWATSFTNFELAQDAKKFVDGTNIPADYTGNGDGAANIVTFGLTKVAEAANNPELLLSFYGVKDGTTDKTPLYLRGKFTNAEAFAAGKIYRVFFPIVDGSWTQPERCVELNVKVVKWEIVPVTPTFN